MKILVINPGSTSTKVSLYEEDALLFTENVFHETGLLLSWPSVNGQVPFRKQIVSDLLKAHGYGFSDVDAIAARGGSAFSQPSGVLRIGERLYRDTLDAVGGSEHPAKLGVLIAYELEKEWGCPSYTLNATNVDEYNDLARVTGIKGVYRYAQSHVLNQKAVARKHAESLGKRYEDCRFIVCHIDGGITVSAHENGRMTDGNVGSGGDGPFSPTRVGSVPVLPLLDYLETHSLDEVRLMCSRAGGFVSWFGTHDADEIHRRLEEGDEASRTVWNAMLYQICKEIGAMSAVLKGKVDAILLTGGLLRFGDVEPFIRERCGWIAPVSVYPGEMEQETLHREVLKVLRGEAQARDYVPHPVWEGFSFG